MTNAAPYFSGLDLDPSHVYSQGYVSPEAVYEQTVSKLVTSNSEWIDVGGGRDIFPRSPQLATSLARRCRHLLAVDPSENVIDNAFAHQYAQCLLEDFRSSQRFDLASLRMVAEHIEQPDRTVGALRDLMRPGARVVVYTVNRYSPTAVLAAITPLKLHHFVKRILWRTEERDTFPVHYRLNTRHALRSVFARNGFREEHFLYLDDCRCLSRWAWTFRIEIFASRCFRWLGLRYPENCLLGIYVRQ